MSDETVGLVHRGRRRSRVEVEQLVSREYESSSLTRQAFCEITSTVSLPGAIPTIYLNTRSVAELVEAVDIHDSLYERLSSGQKLKLRGNLGKLQAIGNPT